MSNIQITELDFDLIKRNLKTYLQGQNVLKDANYEGSVLSILLDILALNTHYNAYYLNMAVNEMFLDTASQRNSVVSIAKLLGYVPSSTHSCTAIVDIEISGLTSIDFTIPKYTKFISENYGNFYTFLTIESRTETVINGKAKFSAVQLFEGEIASPETYGVRYIYNKLSNTKSSFLIPDVNVDINTLEVIVQKSTVDLTQDIYLPKENFSYLDGTSNVYYLEETNNGFYEIYFGDGILGKALSDGNIIYLQYLISAGTAALDANDFKIISQINVDYTDITITTLSPAFGGKDKESISSIKYTAPKQFAAQNRAVSYQDYITALNTNLYNFSFDSVNVWGGEENDPPVYGKVFMSIKPTGAYNLTLPQKEIIKTKIIKPLSVLTVQPEIIDPDYVFIKLNISFLYNKNKTLYDSTKLSQIVKNNVLNYADSTLNTFNSSFVYPDFLYTIQHSDPSIITNECEVILQKKFTPEKSVINYSLDFGTPLTKGYLTSNITSYPGMSFLDPNNYANTLYEVYLEEIPLSFSGISAINVIKSGYGYTTTPEIIITGDGINAKAHAVISNGKLKEVIIDDAGYGYTYVQIEVKGVGKLASVEGELGSTIGHLRLYYMENENKKIYKKGNNEIIGTIDYDNGIIKLSGFSPSEVYSEFGELTINVKPKSNIIYSNRNKIITIDPFVNDSITVKAQIQR